MASLYKPKIISYTLRDGSYRTPDGKRVTKDTPGAVRHDSESKKWYGRYTDGAGRPFRVPLVESRDIARKMLAKLAGDAQLAGVGIADPYGKHRGRALADHLEDYRRYLTAKGNTAGHVAKTLSRARAVIDGCGFEHLDHLEAAAVVEFLGALRARDSEPPRLDPKIEEYTRGEAARILRIHPGSLVRLLRKAELHGAGKGKGRARRFPAETIQALGEQLRRGAGVATCNHYQTAVKGFTRWLTRERRIPADPLSHLSRQNPDTDVRRQRRALPEDLFARFVETTAAGKPFRGLAGADRLVLYTLAANTGFRAGELASLTPASFDLVAEKPTVTVAAAYSKHRRADVQPLRSDVAEMMGGYIAGKPRSKALWPGTWASTAAQMLREDLVAAGIPYRDEAGRYFDFHAMRGQFISLLAARGVHPKVAQELARHSSITLTMDYYTHLDVLDLGAALDRLPGIVGGQEQVASTGPKKRENPAADGKARTRRKALEPETKIG